MSHQLKREYAEYSRNYDFSEKIEQALEDDYAENKYMYSESTLPALKLMLLLCPEATPQDVLDFIRSQYEIQCDDNVSSKGNSLPPDC